MSNLIVSKLSLKNPESVKDYLLNKLGIGSEVLNIDGKITIKVINHFSLFTIITKIRRDFDFQVFHQKGKNEYIIQILN